MRTAYFCVSLLLTFASACGDDSAAVDAGVDPGDLGRDTATGEDSGGDSAEDGGVDLGTDTPACPDASLCGDTDILVDGDWVLGHLDDADLQLLDIRSQEAYDTAHIPGALRLEPASLRATVDGVPGQVVDLETAQSVFRGAGLRNDAAIVVYGEDTGTAPARVVWTLEYFSHARVALLDGGWGAWRGEREEGSAMTVPSEYTIDAIDAARRVDVDAILPTLGEGTLGLVDARTQGEFDGGHIPGALSVNWTRNVSEGALLPNETITPFYASLSRDVPVAAYCQTGSRASVAYVVLRALGFADVSLYDGSWAEWGPRADLPREP